MSPGERLRALMAQHMPIEAMACHSPLSAKLAVEAGFEALWASGFELSALYGLGDVGLVSASEHLEMTRRIVERTNGLVIADLDTGAGNAVNLAYGVEAYERAGAAAIVVEDKVFPKMTSLVEGGRQELITSREYVGKIEAALSVRKSMLVCARTEALVAGLGEDEALRRGEAYAEAGADAVLIHSKQKTPDEILSFCRAWPGQVPLVLVPTSYPQLSFADVGALGKVGLIICGNHAIRAAVAAILEIGFVDTQDGIVRLQRRMVERVLTQCESEVASAHDPLLVLLRRFAVEAAREDARLFCDETATQIDAQRFVQMIEDAAPVEDDCSYDEMMAEDDEDIVFVDSPPLAPRLDDENEFSYESEFDDYAPLDENYAASNDEYAVIEGLDAEIAQIVRERIAA